MAIRDFQFVVGAETSTLPSAGTPSSPSDTITLGYADDHYVQGGAPVADLTALAAVAAADRANGDALLVLSSNTFYRFDSSSAASADGLRIVAPASGTGRWFRVRPGETASNGNYAVAGDINVGGSAIITGNVEVTGNATINGTLTAINSTTLEVVDANILINNGGNTASADLADAGFTVEISDGTNAKVGYDSTLASKFMAGNVGSESEIITASTNQTMTGSKTFDLAPVIKELASTPTTPASGYQKLYPKTDGKFYKLDDAGIEQAIGTGAGGGSINFILNPDAETDTSGWATYADAAGSTPVDGTGGSANVTWTRSTSSPLRGTASFLFTKDAANRQGQGVSYAFTLDSADVSKTIQISFDFDGSLTGYAAGDLTAYIYDVTNSTLITPAAVSLAQARYQFQTTFVASTSTSYRLILHVASTSTTAFTAKVDNVVVGPQLLTLGVARTEWSGYVPSAAVNAGFGTLSGANFQQSRNSDTLSVTAVFNAGTAVGVEARIALPDGLTIAGTGSRVVGRWLRNNSANPALKWGDIVVDAGQNYVKFSSGEYATTRNPFGTLNAGDFVNNGEQFQLWFSVAIAQWAGSGVYLSTAQPEYAFNTSTATAANDTTSFGYGPQGAVIQNITTLVNRRVRFLTPIQPTDKIVVEISANRSQWFSASEGAVIGGVFVSPFTVQNVTTYGVGSKTTVNTTDIDIGFGAFSVAGSTYGGSGQAWSGGSGAGFWRVVKIPGQVQVATPSNIDRVQTRTNASTVSADGTALFNFSGLTAGKRYRVMLTGVIVPADNISTLSYARVVHNSGATVAATYGNNNTANQTGGQSIRSGITVDIPSLVGTTILVDWSSTDTGSASISAMTCTLVEVNSEFSATFGT